MAIITKARARIACVALGSLLTGALAGGSAVAYQGHMWNALHALQAADAELHQAEADKGGHRVNAIHLVDQAIWEVRAGIAAGAE